MLGLNGNNSNELQAALARRRQLLAQKEGKEISNEISKPDNVESSPDSKNSPIISKPEVSKNFEKKEMNQEKIILESAQANSSTEANEINTPEKKEIMNFEQRASLIRLLPPTKISRPISSKSEEKEDSPQSSVTSASNSSLESSPSSANTQVKTPPTLPVKPRNIQTSLIGKSVSPVTKSELINNLTPKTSESQESSNSNININNNENHVNSNQNVSQLPKEKKSPNDKLQDKVLEQKDKSPEKTNENNLSIEEKITPTEKGGISNRIKLLQESLKGKEILKPALPPKNTLEKNVSQDKRLTQQLLENVLQNKSSRSNSLTSITSNTSIDSVDNKEIKKDTPLENIKNINTKTEINTSSPPKIQTFQLDDHNSSPLLQNELNKRISTDTIESIKTIDDSPRKSVLPPLPAKPSKLQFNLASQDSNKESPDRNLHHSNQPKSTPSRFSNISSTDRIESSEALSTPQSISSATSPQTPFENESKKPFKIDFGRRSVTPTPQSQSQAQSLKKRFDNFRIRRDPLPTPKPLDRDTSEIDQMLKDRISGKIKPPPQYSEMLQIEEKKKIKPPSKRASYSRIPSLPQEQSIPLLNYKIIGLNESQKQDLIQSFCIFDSDGDGLLQEEDIQLIRKELKLTKEELPESSLTLPQYLNRFKQLIYSIDTSSLEKSFTSFVEAENIKIDKLKDCLLNHVESSNYEYVNTFFSSLPSRIQMKEFVKKF